MLTIARHTRRPQAPVRRRIIAVDHAVFTQACYHGADHLINYRAPARHWSYSVLTADDKGTSEGGREAGNRLVLQEKVKYILGSATSATAGIQTVTEPAKVLLLANTATDTALGKAFPLTLQNGISHNIMRSNAIYDWLARAGGYPV